MPVGAGKAKARLYRPNGVVTTCRRCGRIAGVPPQETIGVTGDVGAGKSTIVAWLAARGAATCDADHVVHGLLGAPGPVVAAIVAAFGPEVRGGVGVDRPALARRVFGDAAALARLERIVHPAVIAAVAGWLAGVGGGTAVVEAVRLIESGMAARYDATWLVVTDAAVRRARLASRGWSPSEIARRMAAATPLRQRLAASNVVIDNSGSWPATEAQLERAWAVRAAHGATALAAKEQRP